MISNKFLSHLCLVLIAFGMTTVAAKADTIFTGSQTGLCCFNVTLHQVSSTDMQVTVDLTDGAQYFVKTGSGNHPGFAFNLDGAPTISIANISSPWTSGSVHLTSTGTNGPNVGTFNYFITNPGNGASAHNDGPLVFDVINTAGISFNDFVANSSGYFFAADIMNAAGNTGESAINTPGVPTNSPVPEPSSLILLGTGILGAAGALRRRLA